MEELFSVEGKVQICFALGKEMPPTEMAVIARGTTMVFDVGRSIASMLEEISKEPELPEGCTFSYLWKGKFCKFTEQGLKQTPLEPMTMYVRVTPPELRGVPRSADYLKFMMNFAKYAVGNLSFEESGILRVPSPCAVFKKSGEVFPLFLRKAYFNLVKCINVRKGQTKLFSVQGTAGTGKSVFGMLWLLVQAQKGGQVLWHIGAYFYFFDFTNREKANVELLDKGTAEKWMLVEDIWLIADGPYEHQFAGQCYVLQVCAFKATNYHEFAKSPGLQVLYLPVWNEDEILVCVDKCKAQNYETIDEEDVRKCFRILGGVPRYILQHEVGTEHGVADKTMHEDNDSIEAGPESMEVERDTDESLGDEVDEAKPIAHGSKSMELEPKSFADKVDEVAKDREYKAKELIQGAINNFQGYISQLIQVLMGTYVEKISDKLVHCFTTEKCLTRRMDFASDYVKKQLFTFLMKKDKIEFRKWLEDYKDDSTVGCVWGGFFETYGHQVLSKGGSFKLQKLHGDRNEEELVMNSSMEKVVFSHVTDLGRLEKESYGKPPGGFTSIDGLFFKPNEAPVFFQMFKRQTGEPHGFIFDMLPQIDGAMNRPAYKLVCVVPKHLAAITKVQPYYGTKKKTLGFKLRADQLCRDKFTQYVLPLDFALIENESLWKDL